MMLVYFIALLTFTYSHSHDSPEVWTSSVYEFPWFKREDRESQLNRHTVHFPTPDHEARPKSSSALTSEAESPRRRVPPDAPSMESFRPLWAKDGIPPIRGIDPPFARPKKVLQSRWSDSSFDSPFYRPKRTGLRLLEQFTFLWRAVPCSRPSARVARSHTGCSRRTCATKTAL
ncbi:hypothetical protein A0H81_04155 [Grifola frondosa]|uniref:Uncharacterized protein n=1 Tax=Grifola frondosa TaxID=5627 RepID=A0A1C7ME48_GRIFR|nr:hypothetical protein A0H81_04155 [Grifola frondosa]